MSPACSCRMPFQSRACPLRAEDDDAAVSAYVIYTGADWPGIRTALITCFFVAQGTLGETLHKLALRLGGAAIGALIGGLTIVYVLPQMTDIGDLSILIAAVSAICAWVATSSERLAYAGMQSALAFYSEFSKATGRRPT